jgi:hypothetical protein
MYGDHEPMIPEICEYIEERPVYFKKESKDHAKIYVHMNTTEFAEGLLMLDSQDDYTLEAKMRVVFRDIDWNVIDDLTQSFTLVVNAPEEANPCENAELVQAATKARNVYEVAFKTQLDDKEHEEVHIFIENALQTKFVD